jgi:coenzyme F420-reducing hydrogenase delta subunit
LALPEEARVVSLPCAGRLKASQVLDGLRKGFDGVLVVSCHPDACFSQESGDWWGRRVEYLQRILAEAGQEPGRLIHGSAAPNQPRELTALAARALEQVRKLGLNPLKTGAQVRRFLARFTLSADESYTLL